MEVLKLSTIIDNFLNDKIIVMFMYLNNLRKLRLDNELKQEDVAYILNCKRATYSAWERKRSMIPLPIADKLALYYHVSLAYILGLEKNSKKVSYQKIDYNKFLENILLCKSNITILMKILLNILNVISLWYLDILMVRYPLK
mgnify:FL=1